MIQYIEQFLSQPQVFNKIAKMYPNAGRAVPGDLQKIANLEQAIGEIAARSYLQKKESALIRAGLNELKEIFDEKHR